MFIQQKYEKIRQSTAMAIKVQSRRKGHFIIGNLHVRPIFKMGGFPKDRTAEVLSYCESSADVGNIHPSAHLWRDDKNGDES